MASRRQRVEALTRRNGSPSVQAARHQQQGAENFTPLEVILSVADPDRLQEIQRARLNLTEGGNVGLSDDAIGVRLLLDIKTIFEKEHSEHMPSKELAEALAGIETSPWRE